MTLNLLSRRHTHTGLLPLALVCLLLAPAATAQHGGGGMHGGSPGEMAGSHAESHNGGFDQPTTQPSQQLRGGLQLGLGGRWWDDHKTVKKLKLNPDQQQRMDAIFEADKPTLISLYVNLQREQTHLATLSPTDLHDESKVFSAIDRVSQARAGLEKENAHMLLQIRQQLDPDQLQALDHEIASLD